MTDGGADKDAVVALLTVSPEWREVEMPTGRAWTYTSGVRKWMVAVYDRNDAILCVARGEDRVFLAPDDALIWIAEASIAGRGVG
jgi:hypothetical protein